MSDLPEETEKLPAVRSGFVWPRIQIMVGGLLVLFAVVVSAANRWWLFQSPLHMDEYTYLFVGRMFNLGDSWPTLTFIFGADFNWHMLGWAFSLLDSHLSARLLSSFFAALSLIGVYFLVHSVWRSRLQALISVLLLAITAPHMYISSIATYDVIAFCLFTWAMVFFWKLALSTSAPDTEDLVAEKVEKQQALYKFYAGTILIIAAVLSKYVLVLYLPLLLLVLMVYKLRFALGALLCVGSVLLIYVFVERDHLQVLYETQILITQSANIDRMDLVTRLYSQILWVACLLFCVYFVYIVIRSSQSVGNASTQPGVAKSGMKRVLPQFAFLLLALPLPVYHIVSSNQIALIKHLNYFYLFVMPLIAYALIRVFSIICEFVEKKDGVAGNNVRLLAGFTAASVFSAFMAQTIVSNAKIANDLSRGFPDMSDAAVYWQEKRYEKEHSGRILSEDPYLFRYTAVPDFPQALISETTFLDNDLDGVHTSQDVQDAIWDRKFAWVLLTDQIHPKENRLYRRLLSLRGYDRVVSEPYFVTELLTGNRYGTVELYHLGLSKKIALSD